MSGREEVLLDAAQAALLLVTGLAQRAKLHRAVQEYESADMVAVLNELDAVEQEPVDFPDEYYDPQPDWGIR